MSATTGIVLLAHGSRDPQWREPLEAVARRIVALSPQQAVRCAYLELAIPDLFSAASDLIAIGSSSIRVFPVFLGAGKHLRDDLPRLLDGLRASHPHVHFSLSATAGEAPALIDLLARLALQPAPSPPVR